MVYTSLNEAFPNYSVFTKPTYPVGFEANGSLNRVRSPVKPENTVHFMNQVNYSNKNLNSNNSLAGFDPNTNNLTSSLSAPVNFDIINQNHFGPSRSISGFSLNPSLSKELRKESDNISCQSCFKHLNVCSSCRTSAIQILNGHSNHVNKNVEGFNSLSNSNELKKKVDRLESLFQIILFVGIGYSLSNLIK